MANAISSLNIDNKLCSFTLPYGVCSTAADTVAKTVTVPNFSLEAGATVIVKFTNANSVASPTLNVNSTGAKSIMRYGATTASTETTTTGWVAGAVQMFTYDGTNWIRDYWNNTTYSDFVKSGSSAKAGLVPKPSTTAGTTKYLREDGTWQIPPDTDTVYTHPAYTARTGKPTANQTPAFGGTATVSQITSDATGHVTAATDRTITIPSTLSNGTGTAGLIKTTSTVTSNSGYTACPVINGVPYYKDTNTTYSLSSFGLTATAAELNYCDGVTSNIQTQLNGKAASSHTHSYLSLSGGTLTGNLGLGANSLTIGGATLSYNQSSNILDIAKTSGNTASAIGVKLGTKTVGSATQPIYFNAGTPTACTYTLGKSVPSDAKFTDTTYTSLKNPYSLTVKGNGTQSFTYDGSGAKTLNIKAGTNVSVSSDTSGNITINSSMPSHQHTGLVEGNYTAVLTNYGNFRLSAVTTAAETGTIGTEDIPWRAGYFSEGVYSKGNRIPDIASGTSAAQQVAALSYLDVTITFPFTFKSAPVMSLTLNSTSTAGAIGQMSAAVYSVSTTKCVVRIFNGGSAARSPGLHWTATGTKA